MKVIVKARHMDLTPALKQHAEAKLGDALRKLIDRPALKIEIELSDLGEHVHNGNKECRVTIMLPHGKSLTINELDDDMYSAINLAHDRMLNLVKRELGKKRDTHKAQRQAQQQRQRTAKESLTSIPEEWESEVQEFEASQA